MKKELDPYKDIVFFYDGPSYQVKQGYSCNNASCSKDKIRDMPINGHTVGQARKLFDKQLNLSELKIFDKFEEQKEFGERLAGFMHIGEEGDIPTPAQVDKFIEIMHDAYVKSNNKVTVQPAIKGVPTSGDFLDKSEYWRLYMEENKTDKKKEEEAAKKKKDEEEKKRAEEKRKAEEEKKKEEERRKREEEEKKAAAILKVKEDRKKRYADKFGVTYRSYDGFPVFETRTEGVPTFVRSSLQTAISHSIFEALNERTSHNYPDEYQLVDSAGGVLDWYNSVKNTERYVSLEADVMSRIDHKSIDPGLVRQEFLDVANVLHKVWVSAGDYQGYVDSILNIFGRHVIRRLVGLDKTDYSYTFEDEVIEFMDSNKFNIKDVEGSTKKLLLSFTDDFIKKYCEDEGLDEEDTEQLVKLFENIREKMGEKTTMDISPATKEYMKKVGKNGGSRGVVRSITKTSSRLLAEFFAKKSGKKGKALTSLTETLQVVFESEEGRALVGIGLARIAPVICEKAGRPELGEYLREELDTESVSVVSEKATDLATAFGMMGISELLSMVKTMDGGDGVDVTPPKALPVSTVEPVPTMSREEELAGSGRR